MKILMITTYVTLEGIGHKEFERSRTGFGYMVYDIARAVGETEDVDVLATWSRGPAFDHEGIHFLPRSFGLYLRNLFLCSNLWKAINTMLCYTGSFDKRIRFLYCWTVTGYLDGIIKKGGYDVVHIHGCQPANELWMEICRRRGTKFVTTLHGLDSFSDSVQLEAPGKQYERDFLKRVVDGESPITVISTGIKRVIEKEYQVDNCTNIIVVCNSFRFTEVGGILVKQKYIRGKYKIPQNGKILLYVGNISDNKNQRQLAESFGLLSESVRDNTWVLFCGGIFDNGHLQESVNKSPYKERLILCGTVKKAEIADYYREADGVVLLSYAEGFGLSLAEGMHFGVPCVMFKDMDAFEDLYNSCAVVGIVDRNNESVAQGIEELLTGQWNKEKIMEFSKKFESQTMAHGYISVYKNL